MRGGSLSVLLEQPWCLSEAMKAILLQVLITDRLHILILSPTIVGILTWLLYEEVICVSKANHIIVLVASRDADHPDLGVFKVSGTV